MTEVATMVKILSLTAGEWQTLRDLRLAALHESQSAFLGDPAGEAARSEWDWRRECETSRWFAAEVNGEAVGLGKLYRSDDLTESMHIESMWVRPHSRRTGVATALIAAMEDTARRLGESRLGLWVFQGNPDALQLYRSLGYRGPERVQQLQVGSRTETEEEYVKLLLPDGKDSGNS